MLRKTFVMFTAGVGSAALLLIVAAGGCQSESNPGSPNGAGGSGAGSVTSAGGGATTGTATGGSGSTTTTSTTTTSTGTGGGGPSCAGQDATIQDITKGTIGPKVKVKVTGVVAMSHKFRVSKSNSGSCLWGVYVSAPGLSETAANTGILALSYGSNAVVKGDGGVAYCPVLGVEPAGDKIPDDTKPGDVLDLVGETAAFLLPQCASESGGTTVPQRQLAKVCSAVKTGTAAVPTPHVMTPEDIAKLAAPTDPMNPDGGLESFHDQWGGVKVQVNDVTAVTQQGGGVVGDFGVITLEQGNLTVGDKLYYDGYFAAKGDVCHSGPKFSSPDFASIAGFSTIDFCTWSLWPDSKCDDFNPPSTDCMGEHCNN